MTDLGLGRYARPLTPSLVKAFPQFGVETQAHVASIAKLCDRRKQHFARLPSKTGRVTDKPRRPANIVLSEALDFFMGRYWTNVSLGRASGVGESTIRNYLAPEKRGQGKSGKAPSAKLTELDQIATAMGLQVVDLLADLEPDERLALYRKRAAEWYRRTGTLPPWAPSVDVAQAASNSPPASGIAESPPTSNSPHDPSSRLRANLRSRRSRGHDSRVTSANKPLAIATKKGGTP